MPEQWPPRVPIGGVIIPVPGRVPDGVRGQINILHHGPACYNHGSGFLYGDHFAMCHWLVACVAGVGCFGSCHIVFGIGFNDVIFTV